MDEVRTMSEDNPQRKPMAMGDYRAVLNKSTRNWDVTLRGNYVGFFSDLIRMPRPMMFQEMVRMFEKKVGRSFLPKIRLPRTTEAFYLDEQVAYQSTFEYDVVPDYTVQLEGVIP